MQRLDFPSFESFMQELAEVYGSKPYTGAALKHWIEAFTEFPWDKVRYRLILWRDSKQKPPMIADILPAMRDAISDEIERRAIEDKKSYQRPLTPVTEHGKACLAKIHAMLRSPRPKGRWWAYELRDRHRKGEMLSYEQEEMAKRACGQDWNTDNPYPGETRLESPSIERSPGEDDE